MTDNLPTIIAVVLGLIGVLISRQVFIQRENRLLRRRQRWQETLPVTVLAMLITGPFIVERGLSPFVATWTGIGVGWTVILLVELFGKWVLNTLGMGAGGPRQVNVRDMTGLNEIPPGMQADLDNAARGLDHPPMAEGEHVRGE